MSSSAELLRPLHQHRCSTRGYRPTTTTTTTTTSCLENVFITSLLAAGTCHQHRREHGWRKQQHNHSIQRRSYSSQEPVVISREEYNDLVEVYPSFTPDDDNPPKPTHYPLASRLTLTPGQESQLPQQNLPHVPLTPESPEHADQLRQLRRLLRSRLGHISHNILWETYASLPTPRPAYLSHRSIERLFRHLSCTEFKNTPDAMQRYFSLLNEVLAAFPSTPLTDNIWNSAISFAGRWMRTVTSREVKSAVEVWMRMEESGVRATEVTFNILYDLAVRAGRFALAGTLEGELRQRGLPLNRYFRTSAIYAAGLRRDGEGVRKGFRELVDAGEIVDTAVMNCVVLSLVRAGEAGAAGSVFLRMKALHEAKFGALAPVDWREGRELGVRLDFEAKRLRQEEGVHEQSFFGARFAGRERREEVQRNAPIAPDARTYRILIEWAVDCGDLGKARELLEEMKGRGLKVYGSVYVDLMRGFNSHGGFVGGEWTARALEEIWDEVLGSLEQAQPPPEPPEDGGNEDDYDCEQHDTTPETSRPTYFTRILAMFTVQAFYKCTGRKRMLEVWSDVQHLWVEQGGASEEDLAGLRRVVNGLRGPQEQEEE